MRYVEGKTLAIIPIEHAFNRVGDKYVDITFELALNNDPTQYEYVYALRTHRERRTELLNLKIVTMKLKVNEAIARSEANGKKVLKKGWFL